MLWMLLANRKLKFEHLYNFVHEKNIYIFLALQVFVSNIVCR